MLRIVLAPDQEAHAPDHPARADPFNASPWWRIAQVACEGVGANDFRAYASGVTMALDTKKDECATRDPCLLRTLGKVKATHSNKVLLDQNIVHPDQDFC